jgi:hypothetical protein
VPDAAIKHFEYRKAALGHERSLQRSPIEPSFITDFLLLNRYIGNFPTKWNPRMQLRLQLQPGDAIELRNLLAEAGFSDGRRSGDLASVDPLVVTFGVAALGVLAAWIVKNRAKTSSILEVDIRRPDGTHEHVSLRVDSETSTSEAKVLEALNLALRSRITHADDAT